LKSFTVYVETENTGAILVDAYIEVEGRKHMLGQGIVYTGDGYNAKRLYWRGELPMSRNMNNFLYIQYYNHANQDATVAFTGVVER